MPENNGSELLRVAIPSDGEMYESTLAFFAECGLSVNRGNSRRYTGTLRSVEGVQVLFQRVADITSKVEEGSADVGIVGLDRFAEASGVDRPFHRRECRVCSVNVGYGCNEAILLDHTFKLVDPLEARAERLFDEQVMPGLGQAYGDGHVKVRRRCDHGCVESIFQRSVEVRIDLRDVVAFGNCLSKVGVDFTHAHIGAAGGPETAQVALAD